MKNRRAAILRLLEPHNLSPQRQKVAARLLLGDSNEEVAEALGISWSTARVHRAAVFRHFDVTSHIGLVWFGFIAAKHRCEDGAMVRYDGYDGA